MKAAFNVLIVARSSSVSAILELLVEDTGEEAC